MLLDSQREPESHEKLRTVVKIMWVVLAVAALFIAWIFLARWQETRDIEQKALEKKKEEDRRTVELLGGDRLEIQHFFANPGIIRRGESVQICYGVANAKKVRLEPQSNAVWPSYHRCVDVKPTQDTTYTLTIEDAQGRTKSASFTVQVR